MTVSDFETCRVASLALGCVGVGMLSVALVALFPTPCGRQRRGLQLRPELQQQRQFQLQDAQDQQYHDAPALNMKMIWELRRNAALAGALTIDEVEEGGHGGGEIWETLLAVTTITVKASDLVEREPTMAMPAADATITKTKQNEDNDHKKIKKPDLEVKNHEQDVFCDAKADAVLDSSTKVLMAILKLKAENGIGGTQDNDEDDEGGVTSSRRQRGYESSQRALEHVLLQLPVMMEQGRSSYSLSIQLKNRPVPCVCAICLSAYTPGERVSWSPTYQAATTTSNREPAFLLDGSNNNNKVVGCIHAFHTTCLTSYARSINVSSSGTENSGATHRLLCPLCYQLFVS